MATLPKVKLPQSPFVDNQGNISLEWRLWLLNPQFLTFQLDGVVSIDNGGTGIGTTPGAGQILIGDGSGYQLNTLDGTPDRLEVTNAAGSITLDISSNYLGQTSITTLGLVTTGEWQANTLVAQFGGTGISSYAVGDILYADSPTSLTKLPASAAGKALLSGAAPSWGQIDLTTHVTGTLPAANGGTGIASYTVGDILYASSTTALSKLSDVATGSTLISGGVGIAPSWSTSLSLTNGFGCNGQAAQTSATVNAPIAGTAGLVYTATEQTMLNDIKALLNQIRTALIANGITV